MLPTVIVPLQNFNSIKVRLEQPLQEHDRDRIRFQFHKGTIRTWCSMRSTTLTIYFNSIKVRLEPLACNILFDIASFQFHKGTIRTYTPLYVYALALPFQFHKGTIRTNNQGNVNVDFNYFNSIKVRLERVPVSPITRLTVFQFHKGTIRTGVPVSPITRLTVFQFHKGTIRTG